MAMILKMLANYPTASPAYLIGQTYEFDDRMGIQLVNDNIATGVGVSTVISQPVHLVDANGNALAPSGVPAKITVELTRPADTALYAIGDSIGAATVAVKQKEIITLTGTSGKALVTAAGGLSKEATFNTTLTQTATDFVTAHAAAYLLQGIVLTSSTDTLIFEASTAGVPFTAPLIANYAHTLTGVVANINANVAAVKQKDTITLTGLSGTMSVSVMGDLSKIATFDTSLAVTAANFVTAHATAYLAKGIVVTASDENLIFEANVAGVPFDHPVLSTESGTLYGTIAFTTANVTAVKKKDSITLGGTRGTASIGAAGGLTKTFTYATGLTETAAAFVTANAAAYDAQNIVVTSVGAVLYFEAKVAGTTFTSPTFTLAANNLAGTVAHNTANVTLVPLTFADAAISNGGGGIALFVKAESNITAMAGATLRLWFFNASPSGIVGDNVAHVNLYANSTSRCFYVDLTFDALLAGSDTVFGQYIMSNEYMCAAGDNDLYMLVQTLTGFTPTSGGKIKFSLTVLKLA